MSVEQWVRVIRELPNLEEITAQLDIGETGIPNGMIESIENHKSLHKMSFSEMNEVNRKYLCDTINQKWKLISNHSINRVFMTVAVFMHIEHT